jgi:protein involved in polysaccharide export with SLBB domain
MRNHCHRLSTDLKASRAGFLILVALLSVLLGRYLAAQETGQPGGQQSASDQPMAFTGQSQSCYLGPTGGAPYNSLTQGTNQGYSGYPQQGTQGGSEGYYGLSQQGMQGGDEGDSQEQMQGASEDNSQQSGSLQYGQQQYGQQNGQQYGQQNGQQHGQQNGQQYGQQNGQQYGQQEGQYPADQSGMGTATNQPMMPVDQILSILMQDPDTLANSRLLAGQQYGVDPTTIPDNGVYNCIRQDPNFRNSVALQLINQGYIANPQRQMRGPAGPSRPGPLPQRSSEQPSILLKPTPYPYPNLLSLRDLYTQEVPANAKLRRFGSDAFLFGTGNINTLPMDLPVGPDYVLGPGDNLVVNMWGGQSARLSRTVDRQGEIDLPEAGSIVVSGLTMTDAQSAVQKSLGGQFQNEHVELSLGRVRTVRIYVVGDVQRPGAYDVSSLSTPFNALYVAGGPTSRGSMRVLRQYRGNQLVRETDLYDLLLRGVRSDADRLMPGDSILVPPVGPQVSVSGMVRRPAVYELKGQEDLKEVLNLAGGLLVSADLQEIRVERVVAHQHLTMLNVQIPVSANGEVAAVPAFAVQDGDRVQVSPILPYNEQAVFLYGHVYKPGRYPWHEGMAVSDLLHSYKDVMPEPASHAEIVRLVPPDLHPETIGLNLPDALIGNDSMQLQPFDTVRVFGRYDIDPPLVAISGEVLRPGKYPMSQGMTAVDLVRMAGGFKRSAYRKEADLSSYTVENGQRVLVKHSVLSIENALGGDKSADALLQPGDVVGIRQLTGWKDIGASVIVTGEVKFAGTYGVEEGERLSSVLKRAGGFREDAYPQGAVLERVQVRQMEETNRQEMIRRIETTIPNAASGVSTSVQEQQTLLQTMRQQQQDVLAALRSHPSTGRLVIRISTDVTRWENTSADIEMRAGDTLSIPKRADFVLVSGQVYYATGITYRPGKNARWYLQQAGGVTRSGDKKTIFIVRADGSVVGKERGTFFGESILDARMRPGDSIVVPEKITGGSQAWRNVMATAQVASSVALTGAVAGVF